MRLVVISAVYVMFTAQVKADDTEIYIANAAIAPVQPNILFVMDTSGSMSQPPVADVLAGNLSAPSKIDQMKSALTQLINNLNNVNVGLMRFSAYKTKDIYEAGGPVLYPVKDINAGVDPLVYAHINSSEDDGVETPYGGVKLDQGTISMAKDAFDCPTCRVTLIEPLSDDEDIILGDETNPPLAVLGDNDDYLGLRYEIDIPQGATIYSAKIKFYAAANNGDAKYSEPLRMSHDWRRANYSTYPDSSQFTDGTQLDSSLPHPYTGSPIWHGYRKFNDAGNPAHPSNFLGSTVPVFVDGNVYDSNVKFSLSWSIGRSEWESGDHIMYRFYREKVNKTECTANCGAAPIIELAAGYQPANIPQPDNCAAPVCNNNCGVAPIIELAAGYQPANIPQPDTCIPDGEGGENCYPNPDVVPDYVDAVMGPDPAYIPTFDAPVCTPVADVVPAYVDAVMGPDPAYIPTFDAPVCTPVADIVPAYVNAVMGPDPAYIPTFDAPVCTPVADIVPAYVNAVMGPDPAYVPVFTTTNDFPPNDAVRNAHGLHSGTPPTLEVVWLPDDSNQKTALRFDGVFVPQGATITSAFIEFETRGGNSSTSLDIQAEKVANSAPLQEASFNIGSRPLTANKVDWDNIIPWTTDADDHKTTPDVSALVQEVVGQGGWCAGNAMTFVLSGTGARKFKSYDYGSGAVPRLKIRFDENSALGGCNTKQTMSKVASEAEDVQEATAGSALAGFFAVGSIQNLNNRIYDGLGNQSLRFQNIEVPQGAVITSAYLVKTASYNATYTSSTTIRGVDVDHMAPFTMVSGEITALPKVASTAIWDLLPWTVEKRYKSNDISGVIQDIVNRPGWESGNAMGILADDPGEPWSVNNSHVSYSGGKQDKAPELYITYEATFELGSRTVRDELVDLVAGLTAQGSTPISGVMAEAASYYRGEDVYFGQNRGFAPNDKDRRYYRTSHPTAYIGGTRNLPAGCYDTESSIKECHAETITGSPVYKSPVADICQTNNIVLLSDGIPNNNFNSVENIVEPIIVGDGNTDDGFLGYPGCDSAVDGTDCSLKLSEALANEDQETTNFNGIQTVQTHTIGFDLASGGSAAQFLEDLATAGKGGSYSADNAGSLVGVFEAIVRSLEREARTFVSAGVSVNQANRLTHRDELYFGLFKPDTDTVWTGNLKRYRLSNGEIKDVNSVDAVNSEGRFKDLARSFWSDVIDGDAVGLGGSVSQLTTTRHVFSNITSDPITDANNAINEANVNILNADVAALDAADRTAILRWARGLDGAGNARKEMGDPLHSRPVVVTYDDSTATGSPMVFVGTNQGYLHAIDTGTGGENWSFIPKELLQNLTLFKNNSVVANHVYGLDGEISFYHDDIDKDSLIDAGETALLYVGMRRGGRSYYAFDISDRLNPTLEFIIEGGSGAYAELGQSWSKLIPGKIRFNGTDRKVLVFGGGYDTNQDNIGIHDTDSTGRTVFIADALTGALLWDARSNSVAPLSGTSAVSNLTNSIPSDVKAVDLSGSGYIEHIYASDMAGQVFRFDIDNYANTGTANLAVGGRLAHLQTGAVTEENNRRFYYAPDVAAIDRPNYEDFIAVSIGTGYRAHPVNNAINDKFYVIRDIWVLDNKTFPNLPGDIDEGDLADVSNTIGDTNGDGVSDALALIENAGTPKHGWLMDFRQTGEKVLAESITFNEKVIFTTYRPNLNGVGSGICEAPEGSSRAYVLNLVDGTPAIDTNTDGDLEDLHTGADDTTSCGDRCVELGRGIPSRGLVLFQPEGATICFGTQCFDNMLSFQGDRLQRVKWRRRDL